MAFAQGETTKGVSVAIINNKLPRTDGVFSVAIVSATGGADIGGQSSVNVTILSHDNAYGLIGFVNVSALKVVGWLCFNSGAPPPPPPHPPPHTHRPLSL